MRVYFVGSSDAPQRLQKQFDTIITQLSSLGVTVLSNVISNKTSSLTTQDLQHIGQSGEVMIERIDGLIIDGTKPIDESGYLIALALTHKKPILYLAEQGKSFNNNLKHLEQNVATQSLLQLKHFTAQTIETIVAQFVENIEQGSGREKPNIKFTLRITPRIERYLQWKTHNTNISKADFLRDIIEDIIDDDTNYQRHLSKSK